MIRPIAAIRDWWVRNDSVRPLAASPEATPITPPSPPATAPARPWLAELQRRGIPESIHIPSTTLGRLIDQTADRFANLDAIIYQEKSWTFREVLAQVNRTAGGLAQMGVRRGDRVLMALPNCPEFVFAFLGIQKLGAVAINVGPLIGADDLQAAITMTTPRVAIGLDLQAAMMGECGRDSSIEHYVWVSLQEYQSTLNRLGYQFKLWHNRHRNNGHAQQVRLAELLEKAPSRPPTVEPDPEQVAVLQATGGTTGTLKLAQLTHKNLLANVAQISAWATCRPGQERIVTVLPLFHVYGLSLELMTSLFWPGTMLMMTRFDVHQMLSVWRKHRPTIVPLVPAICSAICDEIEKEPEPREPLPPVRVCLSGSAPLPAKLAERFERVTGIAITEGYGLTEASPVTHANPCGQSRPGSIGLPLPDTQVRVVDLDTGMNDVGIDQAGEMLLSGPQIMRGYFASPENTQRALSLDEEGRAWLHTGDVVRMDADGYFHVLDRAKDMIIRSGMKVYPAKVEAVLAREPRVAQAAVVGRSDPVHTECVVAFVVPVLPIEDRTAAEQELRDFCRAHLAPYEVPQEIRFVNMLPRSPLGKLLKRELRALAQANPAAEPAGAVKSGNGKSSHGKTEAH